MRYIKEVISYSKGDISIDVEINYITQKISVVDVDHKGDTSYKKFVFVERELEYMQGWSNILEAIQFAIGEAAKKLEEYNETQSEKMYELVQAAMAEKYPDC